MAEKYLAIETILAVLKATPAHLATITAGLTPEQLKAAPGGGEWSIHEVLAHLRACNDVWGDHYVMTSLAQDQPTIKALNPRTWIRSTSYLEQEFQPSLRSFSRQRKRLLAVLETLPTKDWARTNTLLGAGRPLQQTVLSHADGLARHERAHLKQVERIAKILKAVR